MYNTIQKTIAAWAFNHYVAFYYFDNVNVSQLKVAFEKGEVELENLPIKRDALKQFNLSMEVVSGIVGKLSIEVPLMTMLTDPWVIKISNLMLIVTDKKQQSNTQATTTPNKGKEITISHKNNQSQSQDSNNLIQEGDADELLSDYLNETATSGVSLDYSDVHNQSTPSLDPINSEENRLAEFYSSFSATVASIVKDIYKNIRLELDSMTILFEDFEHGLVKFNVDNLLLHRPKSVRNITMRNVSISLADTELSTSLGTKDDDLIKIRFEKCNLDIHDEASNNMQLVVIDSNQNLSATQSEEQNSDSNSNSSTSSSSFSKPTATASETKIEGTFENLAIVQNIRSNGRNSERKDSSRQSRASATSLQGGEGVSSSERKILNSDVVRIEFKLSNNVDDTDKPYERNLHLKLDLVGMQYIHSQNIYETTKKRLKNLLKFFVKIQTKKEKIAPTDHQLTTRKAILNRDSHKKRDELGLNKLLIINIEDGILYVIDDTSNSCAIPLLEFPVEECRILHFSGKHQRNGLIYANVGCNYYNRELSAWDTLLQPWRFNVSWDDKSAGVGRSDGKFRTINLNSDESASFALTSAFLDLGDVALRRLIDNILHPKSLSKSLLQTSSHHLSQDFNSIFVLHNETGHRLYFAPVEHNFDSIEASEFSRSSPTSDCGDTLSISLKHKLSIHSRSSTGSRDSPDHACLAKWNSVDVGESISFSYDTLPIYRRHISDLTAKSRVLLLRVEGWKSLAPISIDKSGTFFREACSDRVTNEDTHIAISINLEESSARKIISVRSPLNLVNSLDTTLEVHFVESNQALYIKPDSHLAVPLPYIFNRMHIRPCNVGVTMNDRPILWDEIRQIVDVESRVHTCHPITITNAKHASYCTSQSYKICVSTERDGIKFDKETPELIPYYFIPIFTMRFIPPMTIVNLLPCELQFMIDDIKGSLAIGSQQRVYHVDTTRSTEVAFALTGFQQSKSLTIEPGATSNFHVTLEMFDKRHRSLYLNAKIVFTSSGTEPAIQIIVQAPFWFINKTGLPLVFKQDGANKEAAGQFRDNEERSKSILLFSFYETEIEPPWLCSMRIGESKGASNWCDGFKLEKGNGERRLSFTSNEVNDSRPNKSLIDINIRRGFGRYSQTMIVTFTARYGFNPLTKTPKKLPVASPQNYKLTSYNHNVNLAGRIADHAVNLFNAHQHKITSDVNVFVPGLKLTLIDNNQEKLMEASADIINLKCTTKAKEQILDCSIQDIRINNLMLDCEKEIVLDRACLDSHNESLKTRPAIRIIMDRVLGNSFGTTLFRQVQLSMCEIVLNIEEKLMLKLVEFISFRNRNKRRSMNNLSNDIEKILNPEDDRMAKYYFDLLRIDLSSLKLSVFASANLSTGLQKLKSYLGLKFFSFEEAQVELNPYFKMNVSNTFRGVFDSVTRFYKRQILEQAPRIVGQQIQNYLRFHLSDLLSTLYDEVYHKLFN